MKSMKRLSSICMSLLMVIFITLSPISVLAEEQVDISNEDNEILIEDDDNEQSFKEEDEPLVSETEEKDEESTELELEDKQENGGQEKGNLNNDGFKSSSNNDEERNVENNSTSSKVEEEQVVEKQVKSEEVKDYDSLISQAIDEASVYIQHLDYITEWQAIGLIQAGKEVPDQYDAIFKQQIKDQITNGLENGRILITDIERLAMTAVAIGKDPQDVYGHNLIKLIYNSPDRYQSWNDTYEDTMTFQGNNGPIFALIALDTNNFHVPDDARWSRQDLIEELLRTQNADGSWHLNEMFDSPSIDITAMALIGLSPYKNQPKVKEALDKTVDYLSNIQTDNGGFDGGSFVGGITSEATSQAIIGLTAYGIDPTSDRFTKNGISLIDHLLDYQNDDGGFMHTHDYTDSNAMATEQALQGLVAYQFFLEGKGSLYHFEEIDTTPKEPEPEEPEIPEEPKPEKPEEKEMQIKLDKEVEVEQGAEITIEKSRSKVVMPEDLPIGTKLFVTKPEIKRTEQSIKSAGDLFNFNFKFPNGEKFEGIFTLSLAVHDDADIEKTGIYYFNEKTQLWEYVGGKGTAKDGLITIEVDHFSTYGVFEDIEDEGTEDEEVNDEATNEELNEDDQSNIGNNNDSDNNHIETNEDEQSLSDPTVNEEHLSKKLPETATNSFNLLLISSMLVVFGLLMFLRKKKYAKQ